MEEVPLAILFFRGLAVLGLVAANAFFVCAEFALVAARPSGDDELAPRDDSKAKRATNAIQSFDRYIPATQLGITLASIGLLWVGEPLVAVVLRGWFGNAATPLRFLASDVVAVGVAFALLAALHIVIGELIPKAVAARRPEAMSRWVAGPLLVFATATGPIISLLDGSAKLILRVFGARSTPEEDQSLQSQEIMRVVRRSQASGLLDTQDVRLFEGVLEFTEKTARDVMTPRTEMVALEATMTVEESAARVAEEGRSRYPLINGSLDNVVGIVHAKEILASLPTSRHQKLEAIMQDALFVPGSREIEDLLGDMQRIKRHMAVVLDEYGGTAGVVTMEDLLEEIVGQIFDEYDEADAPMEPTADTTTLSGQMEIDEANEQFGLGISSEHYTTVGGFVFGSLGRLPRVGDRVPLKHVTLEVTEMAERRVGTLRIRTRPTSPRDDPGGGQD